MPTKIISATLLVLAVSVTAFGQTAARPAEDLDYQVAAVLYQQKAAEYRALAYQAFSIARLRLDSDLHSRGRHSVTRDQRMMPRAIVVDIDETVLDNSPSQAYAIKNGRPFNTTDWYSWGEMRKAKAVPGSVDFLNYAASNGVKIFYISNRDEVQKKATIDNLVAVGFRDIGPDNVLLRQKDGQGRNISTKTPRRDLVAEKYRIVMLIGDNLDDFSDVFERKPVPGRFAETDRYRDEWGKRWIVLPNAMYGTWENAIYEYKQLTEAEKAEVRSKSLEIPQQQ